MSSKNKRLFQVKQEINKSYPFEAFLIFISTTKNMGYLPKSEKSKNLVITVRSYGKTHLINHLW